MSRWLFIVSLCVVAPLLSGCGRGDWGTASGKVTVDGAPLEKGTITFLPEGQGATAYGQVTNGSYVASTGQDQGLKTGKYKVTVSAMTVPEMGTAQTAKLLTPEKYAKPETTDLQAEVRSGSNSFDFDLKSK